MRVLAVKRRGAGRKGSGAGAGRLPEELAAAPGPTRPALGRSSGCCPPLIAQMRCSGRRRGGGGGRRGGGAAHATPPRATLAAATLSCMLGRARAGSRCRWGPRLLTASNSLSARVHTTPFDPTQGRSCASRPRGCLGACEERRRQAASVAVAAVLCAAFGPTTVPSACPPACDAHFIWSQARP